MKSFINGNFVKHLSKNIRFGPCIKPISVIYKLGQIDVVIKKLKMNFKLFTSALMATAATAQSAGQDNSLGDALHQNFQEMPAHVQRRFWVRIQLYNASRKMSINKLFSINWLQTLLMQLSTITSVKSITNSGLLEVGA